MLDHEFSVWTTLADKMAKINLWHIKMACQIRLGDLVTVLTTHISSASCNFMSTDSSQAATLVTEIYSETEADCAIRKANQPGLHRSICNTPLGYVSGRPLFGLMSLKTFFDDRCDEVLNTKILVCVKVVGSMPNCMFRQTASPT